MLSVGGLFVGKTALSAAEGGVESMLTDAASDGRHAAGSPVAR